MCEGKILRILKSRWSNCEYLSKGGNSWVYKVTSEGIAIKVYRRLTDLDRYPRFVEETKTMRSLNGLKSIVPIIELNESMPERPIQCENLKSLSDIAYFVMPLYHGVLNDKLEAIGTGDGTLSVQTALKIAKAIKALHDKNLAHRDLKPENILYDKEGTIFISDFGLSIDLNNVPEPNERDTKEMELIGSVTYRAPELLRGRLDNSDHRPCDIFSLGRILWALIHGKEPIGLTDLEFTASSVQNCGRILKRSKTLDDIITGMTLMDPRFRMNIGEVIDALESWLINPQKDSTEEIISQLINNATTMDTIRRKKLHDDIIEKHRETVEYVANELTELTKEWKKGGDKYLTETGLLNPFSMSVTNAWGNDFSPKISISFNQANIQASPLMTLIFSIKLNSSDYENQQYMIIAKYIDREENEVLISDETSRAFDARSGSIRQTIVKELEFYFTELDQVLKSYKNT